MRQDEANASSWFCRAFFFHVHMCGLVKKLCKLIILPRLGFYWEKWIWRVVKVLLFVDVHRVSLYVDCTLTHEKHEKENDLKKIVDWKSMSAFVLWSKRTIAAHAMTSPVMSLIKIIHLVTNCDTISRLNQRINQSNQSSR